MEIVRLSFPEFERVMSTLNGALENHRAGIIEIHTMRVAIDEGHLKFKMNEGIWTPGYGVVHAHDRVRHRSSGLEGTAKYIDLNDHWVIEWDTVGPNGAPGRSHVDTNSIDKI